MNISNYNQTDFNATYSPEDNKLRLYANVRIDSDDWQEMKKAGWKWAPKQELFYCFWSVDNEDFCLALAGDIMPEECTMVERAEAKAQRLLILAEKRADQSVGYQRAAIDLMNRIDNNQPILIGHHSQKKQEKINKQIDRAVDKAKETGVAVGYWVWRAKGVVGNANYKNNTRTIYNRIKTLQKDLRSYQRDINEAAHYLALFERVKANTDTEKRNNNIETLVGFYRYGDTSKQLREGELTHDQALEKVTQMETNVVNSKKRARVINHILNRLAYEQSNLCIVSKFDGVITAPVLQTFLRTHGADKPKATKTDYGWLVESKVNLPLHIGNGLSLELDENEWRDLMQNLGYEVPVKTVVTNPILNFKTDKPLQSKRMYGQSGEVDLIDQVEMTKGEYSRIHSDRRFVKKSACGTFRFKVAAIQNEGGRGYWDTTTKAVFLTDSKAHAIPESMQETEGA